MKITITCLCLSVCAVSAQAEWLLYGDNGKAAFYYDPASVNTQQGRVTVLEMLDYSFPLNRVLSAKTHKEFDCEKQKFRNSGSDTPDEDWREAVQGTRNLELLQLLCPKIS